MANDTLYNEVVTITDKYFGPTADRFVIRQIRNHLQKDPHELQADDLHKLIDWIKLAMKLVSNDTKVINRYVVELESLVHIRKPLHNGKHA